MNQIGLNLPNSITLARLLAAPLIIWLILGERYGTAFWIFVAAGVSDGLDGYIAKRFNMRTRLGALLDPIADKALLASVFLSLGFEGQLPDWLVILVVFRDVMIVGGYILIQVTAAARQFDPLYISKVNTTMQIALVSFVLARLGLGFGDGPFTLVLVVAVAVTTVLSGGFYFVRWARILAGAEPVLVTPRVYRVLFWLGLFLAAFILLGLVQAILLPFAAGLVIAYILAPMVGRFERRGIGRSLGSLFVLVNFLLVLILILLLLVPLIQVQVVQLIGRVPGLVTTLQNRVGNLMDMLQQHLPAEQVDKIRDVLGGKLGEVVTWLASAFQSVLTSSFAILNVASLLIVTPIVTFFLLRDWVEMVALVDSYLPRQSLDTLRGLARVISDTLVGFIRGQALICMILATYYSIALTVAGLDSSLALGVLIGILAIIPILGVTTGFVLAIGLAASQYGTWTAVFVVAGIFIFGQLVEANILTPKLVGDRIHLHPVWVIFALFAGGTLAGFVGILLAVPAAAVIGVLTRFALGRYRGSTLYDPLPARNVGRAVADAMTQLTLDWPPQFASGRADFLVSDSNKAALDQIEAWPEWPARGLVLYGPSGSGKTHLAHLWCARATAVLIDGAAMPIDAAAQISGPVAVDNADRAPEPALLHLYNAVVERGGTVLIVAPQAPASWPIALADLASRLRALPAAGIAAPDDALLAAVLIKHFADRQLRVGPEVIGFLIRRMERSFAAAAGVAQRLDRLALSEGGAITVPLARRLLALNPSAISR